eukprot:gene33705-45141_t
MKPLIALAAPALLIATAATAQPASAPYRASGSEPNWTLRIDRGLIAFAAPRERLRVVASAPVARPSFNGMRYVTPRPTLNQAITHIKAELKERLDWMIANGKLLEAQRLEQRTRFDIEMIETTGSCAGIENYSRYLTGRRPGEPPPTFFEYIPDNALLFTDESHQTVPQIGAMYRGDYRRKWTLAEYGFRLPSALDNRPLKFEEWEAMRPQTVHVSATMEGWAQLRLRDSRITCQVS